MGVTAVIEHWQVEEAAWFDYLATITDEILHQAANEDSENGPKVWQIIMPFLTHSIQHRAEAAYILTSYGHSPGELDFAVFMKGHSEET